MKVVLHDVGVIALMVYQILLIDASLKLYAHLDLLLCIEMKQASYPCRPSLINHLNFICWEPNSL